MTAVLVANSREDGAPDAVTKPGGGSYRYEMIFAAGATRAYADHLPDLVEVLIPGYTSLGDEEAKIAARVKYATDLLAGLQAQVLQASDDSGLSDAERAVVLQPRHEPVVVEEWASEVPLVLLDVHYAPFSDIPAPVSALEDVAEPRNVVWLRAVNEDAFLVSLHNAGVIQVAQHSDFDA